ncbi:MAG: hypothetical protein IT385_04230 [Deltaproteobacteria bacterium]|nr:hypothetical protein [Deltaproteobacteria bacterium]
MRTLLILLLVASLISFGVVYLPIVIGRIRRRRDESVPLLGFDARRAAERDERIREAVDIRERIADYARRKDVGLDRSLVVEVDELIATMLELARIRHELLAHLEALTPDRLARDAALLDAGTLAAQRRQVDELRRRADALEGELARAASGLRETWLGLLDALATPGAGSLAATRTREQIEALRIRIAAEKEARQDVNEPA